MWGPGVEAKHFVPEAEAVERQIVASAVERVWIIALRRVIAAGNTAVQALDDNATAIGIRSLPSFR